MTLALSHAPAADIAADLLVIPVGGPPADDPILRRIGAPLRDALVAEARRRQFTGARGQECWAHGLAAKTPLVLLLPIVHTSVEELAQYLAGELRRELDGEGVGPLDAIEVAVEESFGQRAIYRREG